MHQFPKIFFDPTNGKYPQYPPRPTDDEIREQISEESECPLNQIIVSDKNKGNMDKLRAYAFGAYRNYDRNCAGMNFGIYAGPGQGKTTIAKTFIKTIGIPEVIVQSDTLKTTWQLWNQIKLAFEKFKIELVPQSSSYHYVLPPCIVMFDEAHRLPIKLRTGGLLNAMEYNDAILKTTDPNDENSHAFVIDCSNVMWICASTDPGIIFERSEAFYSRFSEHILWHPATQEEVAVIVFHNMLSEGKHIPRTICAKIAFYCKNPRIACAFARNVELMKCANNLTWEEAVEKVARDSGIDEFGMTSQQLKLLASLGQTFMAKKNLTIPLCCRIEELDAMILPPLLTSDIANGIKPLVAITQRGCAITEAGLKELDKRGIGHRGITITAEHLN